MDKETQARLIRLAVKYGDMRAKSAELRSEASSYYKTGLLDAAERSIAEADKMKELADVTLSFIESVVKQ